MIVAPYRHPVVLAKAVASLDALSGGRVVLGVASGWHEAEFAALGVPFAERGRRTDDTIRACRALWSGAPSFRWDGVDHAGFALLPPPARAGGPPLWIGGNSDAGLRRAARQGDGWHTTIADEDGLAERIGVLDGALAREGRSRSGFVLSVRVRADAERMARVAPRLRALGVDHVLVDPPVFDAERFGDEVAAVRRIVDAERCRVPGARAERPDFAPRIRPGVRPGRRLRASSLPERRGPVGGCSRGCAN